MFWPNLEIVPVPEIIEGTQKFGYLWIRPRPLYWKILVNFCSDGPCECNWPNLNSVALPIPEIITIEVLGGVANPQSSGRGGRRRSGMVSFERALVISCRPSAPP